MRFSSAALVAVLGFAAACGSGDKQVPPLNGAGATFPYPVYSRWFADYAQQTGVRINYQSIGSGGGIRQFTEGTVDFGATDGPMSDEQIAAVAGNVVHLPTLLGAVVLTYNLPSLAGARLRLDAPTIVDIFMGNVTKWNHPRIAALNPDLTLPDRDLLVVHRSDGSGTTFVFVDYLSKVSDLWRTNVGAATSVSWPVGLGGKGNEGITQQVKQTEGAIGYVELVYAASNNLPFALVQNQAGAFADATLESVSAAAAGAGLAPDTDFRVSITHASGAESYPIVSFTWLLVRTDNPDEAKAKTIHDFAAWMISAEAQETAKSLGYAPLPAPVAALVRERLGTLKAGGAPIG